LTSYSAAEIEPIWELNQLLLSSWILVCLIIGCNESHLSD